LHRSKTRRTETVVRQTQKRKSGTRTAADCTKDAGANAAQSRAATISSASIFREEFINGPALIVSTRICSDNLLHQSVESVKPGCAVKEHKGALAWDRADPVGLAAL